MLLVVFGFTHSLIVLLRQKEDQYFQENYSGDVSALLGDGSPMSGEATLYDLSSSNGFNNPFKAFHHVWMFIYGVWDPIMNGDAGDNQMLFVMAILFAFIAVLTFTNMIMQVLKRQF